MKMYRLNQVVLRVRGNAAHFLNGLTSNTLDKPRNAFVNLHGRVIATCFQQQVSDDEFLLAVAASAVEPLLKHLDRYARLNRTQLETTSLNVYLDIGTGHILFKEEDKSPQVSLEEFVSFRLQHHLPLMDVDYHADEFILNIDPYDQYVSYTKGCFLGQEPVAKVHNRSKPSKKLIVKFEDECSEEEKSLMTSKIKDPRTGRSRGFVFVKNN